MPEQVRAKFQCHSVKVTTSGEEAQLGAVTPDSSVPENERYHNATPSGTLTLFVTNPAVKGFYKPGKSYYLTMVEAE